MCSFLRSGHAPVHLSVCLSVYLPACSDMYDEQHLITELASAGISALPSTWQPSAALVRATPGMQEKPTVHPEVPVQTLFHPGDSYRRDGISHLRCAGVHGRGGLVWGLYLLLLES